MKKVFLFSALVAVMLLTACSSTKRVVCNQKVSIVDVDMFMDFKGEKLSGMGLKYTMDLSSYSDEQISELKSQNLCSNVQAAMGTYASAFTNCKQEMSGKNLIITADFILEKLPGYEEGKNEGIDKSIQELENQGYKCTK